MYKTKAEVYDLECDEITSILRPGFHVGKQHNHFNFLSLPFSVPNTISSFFPLFSWPQIGEAHCSENMLIKMSNMFI